MGWLLVTFALGYCNPCSSLISKPCWNHSTGICWASDPPGARKGRSGGRERRAEWRRGVCREGVRGREAGGRRRQVAYSTQVTNIGIHWWLTGSSPLGVIRFKRTALDTCRAVLIYAKVWIKGEIGRFGIWNWFILTWNWWLTVRVLFPPLLENELLDMPVEQFLASLRFPQRVKLDQLGIEIGSFDWKSAIYSSSPDPAIWFKGITNKYCWVVFGYLGVWFERENRMIWWGEVAMCLFITGWWNPA